eukprot:1860975-Lingulodinium_polyedra.AAC.1
MGPVHCKAPHCYPSIYRGLFGASAGLVGGVRSGRDRATAGLGPMGGSLCAAGNGARPPSHA